ncbi:hypothetical protein B0T13DRAFT_443758 [Neurospora crassa]|nr:hypothetical protein B0T13DRAFT_443758 [Neurospora crassa]
MHQQGEKVHHLGAMSQGHIYLSIDRLVQLPDREVLSDTQPLSQDPTEPMPKRPCALLHPGILEFLTRHWMVESAATEWVDGQGRSSAVDMDRLLREQQEWQPPRTGIPPRHIVSASAINH